MNKPPYIHEAKTNLSRAESDFTQTNSLSAQTAFGLVQSCEFMLRDLYFTAVNSPFPSDKFKPYHQPKPLAVKLGVFDKYSDNTQRFLEGIEGRAISDARYPESQGYKNYTNEKSETYSRQLIKGTKRFIEETLALEQESDVLESIRNKFSR